jgi:hypothetical protein
VCGSGGTSAPGRRLGGDGDLDLDSGLERDRGLSRRGKRRKADERVSLRNEREVGCEATTVAQRS